MASSCCCSGLFKIHVFVAVAGRISSQHFCCRCRFCWAAAAGVVHRKSEAKRRKCGGVFGLSEVDFATSLAAGGGDGGWHAGWRVPGAALLPVVPSVLARRAVQSRRRPGVAAAPALLGVQRWCQLLLGIAAVCVFCEGERRWAQMRGLVSGGAVAGLSSSWPLAGSCCPWCKADCC